MAPSGHSSARIVFGRSRVRWRVSRRSSGAPNAARRYSLETANSITGVDGSDVERAARLLWEARPVAFYAWSGVEQQTGSTQIFRAISFVYALTGCF